MKGRCGCDTKDTCSDTKAWSRGDDTAAVTSRDNAELLAIVVGNAGFVVDAWSVNVHRWQPVDNAFPGVPARADHRATTTSHRGASLALCERASQYSTSTRLTSNRWRLCARHQAVVWRRSEA